MQHLIEKAGRGRNRYGFTLVELLVVIVVLAVLAAIVLPKFMNSGTRSKESALKSDLKLLRSQVSMFQADTGSFPKTLADLAATSAPLKGLDSSGAEVSITSSDWHGPYIDSVPKDPITKADFTYGTTSPDVGKVTSSSTATSSEGTAYNTW